MEILDEEAERRKREENTAVNRSLGWEEPLEKGMATHSSILAWKNPMDGGAWQATVHGVASVGRDLVTKPPPQAPYRASHLGQW